MFNLRTGGVMLPHQRRQGALTNDIYHQLVYRQKIAGSSSIKHLEFEPSGRYALSSVLLLDVYTVLTSSRRLFAIASNDHVVRPVEFERPANNEYPHLRAQTPDDDEEEHTIFTVLHELADRVNRTAWNGVTWSKTGDYVVGGKQTHLCRHLTPPNQILSE